MASRNEDAQGAAQQAAFKALNTACRRQMHRPLKEQHASLSRRIRGHYNYFGINGNIRALQCLLHRAERVWHRHLRRRSQKARRLTWEKFGQYLKKFPLPQPRVFVQVWD